MISLRNKKGDWKKTEKYLENLTKRRYYNKLKAFAEVGLKALEQSTPVRTGKTASSWGYEIVQDDNGAKIFWTNSNINNGVPIAVILQYGHGTGTGGYVQGIDYINPAMQPVFAKIVEDFSKEVANQ